MLYTTFNLAKAAGACSGSYEKMARALGGVKKYGADTPIPLAKTLEVCRLDNTLWTLRCTTLDSKTISVTYACDCAERVLPVYEAKYPDDKRVRSCIEIPRKYLTGEASEEDVERARTAAATAAEAAEAAWAAAWAAEAARADAAARAAEAARADAAARAETKATIEAYLLSRIPHLTKIS